LDAVLRDNQFIKIRISIWHKTSQTFVAFSPQILTWWFATFMAPAIKPKIQNLAGLQELFSVIEPSQLEIPAFISEHDITLHGFAGVAYSLNHSKTNTPSAGSTPAGIQSLSPTVPSPFGI
jgi:hypothetical protein